MMAANYRHIGGAENRLGRHYSRFSAVWPSAALGGQSLALRKLSNARSNRRSRVRLTHKTRRGWTSNGGPWVNGGLGFGPVYRVREPHRDARTGLIALRDYSER